MRIFIASIDEPSIKQVAIPARPAKIQTKKYVKKPYSYRLILPKIFQKPFNCIYCLLFLFGFYFVDLLLWFTQGNHPFVVKPRKQSVYYLFSSFSIQHFCIFTTTARAGSFGPVRSPFLTVFGF